MTIVWGAVLAAGLLLTISPWLWPASEQPKAAPVDGRLSRLLQEAGMSEEDMVRSATVQAAALLGLEEDIGTIGAGKVADIIAVRADPLKDITVLERVEFVMKGGVVIRNDVAE